MTGGHTVPLDESRRFAGDDDPAVLDQIEACQVISEAILREVAEVMDRHGIPFYLDAGTLLGAFRQGGWIPWDDDIDLLMFREDYERFRAVRHELPVHLELTDAEISRNHVTQIPRIGYRFSGFEWGERLGIRAPERQRIVIDIYLIDAEPEGPLRQVWMRVASALRVALAMRATNPKRIAASEQSAAVRALGLGFYVAARAVPRRWLQQGYLALAKAGDPQSPHVVVLNHDRNTRANSLPRKLFTEQAVRLPFEGRQYLCPAPEHYLTAHFGSDFRQLPPVQARRPHPAKNFWAEFQGKRWGAAR